jgi:hypothetical protein
VFSLLDRLEGWQLLLLLAPLIVIMTIIKKREEAASSMHWARLNQLQKGWVFLSLLAPGLAARVLTLLDQADRERLIGAGGALSGSPRRVAYKVLKAFFDSIGDSLPGKDVDEICRWLNLKFEEEPEKLLGSYRKAYLT